MGELPLFGPDKIQSEDEVFPTALSAGHYNFTFVVKITEINPGSSGAVGLPFWYFPVMPANYVQEY